MPYKPVPRLHNFSYAGLHRYSLTICTSRRQQVFVNREAVDLVLWQLLQSASRSGFAVIAYCFMPDHLHLLVEGTDDHAALLANPLRAGLVHRVEDYPYLGSATMSIRDLLDSAGD